jgi:hypothetical protein
VFGAQNSWFYRGRHRKRFKIQKGTRNSLEIISNYSGYTTFKVYVK